MYIEENTGIQPAWCNRITRDSGVPGSGRVAQGESCRPRLTTAWRESAPNIVRGWARIRFVVGLREQQHTKDSLGGQDLIYSPV